MINSTITPIDISEASIILDKPANTIRHAVFKNILSNLPSPNQKHQLIKEQVELFKDKKQLRYSLLSENEKMLYQQYKNIAENTVPTSNIYTSEQVGSLIASIKYHYETMSENDKKELVKTGLIILGIIAVALGTTWYLQHKKDIDEKISEITPKIQPINKQLEQHLKQSLQTLNQNADVNTVINTILKEVA